ncbi:hypothetical protein BJY52DRAFT_1228434 [Lactarius psammicola]|nr:hypothetical protein BJY52DRAFT_1228434 [Lactarius psammicola]
MTFISVPAVSGYKVNRTDGLGVDLMVHTTRPKTAKGTMLDKRSGFSIDVATVPNSPVKIAQPMSKTFSALSEDLGLGPSRYYLVPRVAQAGRVVWERVESPYALGSCMERMIGKGWPRAAAARVVQMERRWGVLRVRLPATRLGGGGHSADCVRPDDDDDGSSELRKPPTTTTTVAAAVAGALCQPKYPQRQWWRQRYIECPGLILPHYLQAIKSLNKYLTPVRHFFKTRSETEGVSTFILAVASSDSPRG